MPCGADDGLRDRDARFEAVAVTNFLRLPTHFLREFNALRYIRQLKSPAW